MRWCAALSVVLVALLVVTVKICRHPRKRVPAAPPPDIAESAAPPVLPAPAVAPRAAAGIAHLHGRVLFPDGREPTDDVEVVAEDGTRSIAAQVTKNDRFQIHLPAGRYTLVASAGELVGVVPDVLARDGNNDVDIRLAVGATIRGRVTGDDDAAVEARPAGGREETGVATLEDGVFRIGGLIPGRRYDLRFHGDAVRTLSLTGVEAPADRVDVALEPRANIRGAIGFPAGTRCPIDSVSLQIPGRPVHKDDDDDDDGTSAEVERDCAFSLSVPDQAAVVTVVATGSGWHLEAPVVIPPHGDPEPICLNPPCRSDPAAPLARLRVTLDNVARGSSINATINSTDESSHVCYSSGGSCDFDELTPGETVSVTASGDDCHGDAATITLVAGDNYLRIPCRRQRRVEGVVRMPEAAEPEHISIRCAGGAGRPLRGTHLFRLTCAAEVSAVEYQIGEAGSWRSVPIASAADPALVEIAP